MLGRSVPVSENGNGIHIFARSTFGKGYTLADAYDVRQTQGRPLKEVHLENDTRDMESAITTLLNYAVCQVVIDKELDTPAVYDPQRMELAINPDYPDHEMFAAIATAVAHSRLHGKGYNAQYDYAESDLDAQSVSYLLCRRFGVERDLPDTADLSALYEGWDAQERRQALDQIQKMSKQIGASVEKSIRHREAASRCSTTDVRVSPCWGSVSRRTTPVKAGRLPCGSHPRAAQRARWAGLDRSRAAAYKAYKGETLTIRAERG